MHYFIMSRQAALKFADRTTIPTIIISITDTNKESVPYRANTKIIKKLCVSYDFISKRNLEAGENESKIKFSPYQAERIKEFLETYMDQAEQLIVQGEYGIGRSAGIMAAIREWIEGDDGGIWEDPRYRPDAYSYKLMTEAFTGEVLELDFKKRNFDLKMINTNPDGTVKGDVKFCRFPRQTYINGSVASRAHCLGYCWLFKHRGYLNKALLEAHGCVEKQCPLFQKFEDHPYWRNKAAMKQKRIDGKLQRKREEAFQAQILRAFREATESIDNFAVCGIEKDGDSYCMRCVSLQRVNLWQAIEDIQDAFGIYVRVKFIKNSFEIRQRLVDKCLMDPQYFSDLPSNKL